MATATDRFIGVDVQLKRGVVVVVMDAAVHPLRVEWFKGSDESVAQGIVALATSLTCGGRPIVIGIDSPRCPLREPREWYWSGSGRTWRRRRATDIGSGRHCEVVLAALRLANPQWTPAGESPDWMKLGFGLFSALEFAGLRAEEVFPTASYRQLRGEDLLFSVSTRSLAEGPRDVLDASLAAVSVREYSKGRGCEVGGGDGLGAIVLPRPVAPGPLEPVLRWPSAACSICAIAFDGLEGKSGFGSSDAQDYPGLVCRRCDERAVGARGGAPEMQLNYDAGENPIFIDGLKCWRRYKFGGFVTMRDLHGCQTLEEFYRRVESARAGSKNEQP